MPLRVLTRLSRTARGARAAYRALTDVDHPVLVHLIVTRRCNLACAYCTEYDDVSRPVPLDLLARRVDLLADLGTSVVTLSGGEPMLHPQIDQVVAHLRRRGMSATLITNGYLLTPERIRSLNVAGLDHLQISIDNVEPDAVSMKSLRLLDPKLVWLAELADFTVAINSVLGAGVRDPGDSLAIARRARELGLMTSVGIIHDGRGQLRPLADREMRLYEEIKRIGRRGGVLRLNGRFQDNLARGRPNAWRCRAGARYLYVDEFGRVSYCSQMRGSPGVDLETYSQGDIRRAYRTSKPCAPFCTVNCVQQVALADNWRSPQTS